MTVQFRWLPGAAALLVFLAGASAQAATLEGIQGTVLVDHGSGYSVAHGPMQLNPGDSVIANPGGAAKVVYADGCSVPVQPGSVVAVAGQSPCSIETGAVDPPPTEGVFNTTTLLVGGVIVGGVVAAVVLLNDNGDDAPASP